LLEEVVKLQGARVTVDAGNARPLDLSIRRGRIQPFDSTEEDPLRVDLSGYLLLPGLINSHDHLEFNLFPRLGEGPHANYVEWAESVYHPRRSPLKEHLLVPKPIRLMWGGLKNLLGGATTVCHHNPYESSVFDVGFPVRVVRRFGWAHSLHFSQGVSKPYRDTPKRWPFLLHAAEGTCRRAWAEVERLKEAGVLSGRTVLIHGVALDAVTIELLKKFGTSLVWCPSSNLFTLGQTLRQEVFDSGLSIALGTDSALTGKGDLIDELCVAHCMKRSSITQLFDMVTRNAAEILHLSRGEGEIREEGLADLVAVADKHAAPAETLLTARPELVILRGKMKLISRRLADRLPRLCKTGLETIYVEGRGEYLVDARIRELHAATAQILGRNFRLAGRTVCV
jgi:cytosine/adenosine deaminase-related metal-dependent hydrolase